MGVGRARPGISFAAVTGAGLEAAAAATCASVGVGVEVGALMARGLWTGECRGCCGMDKVKCMDWVELTRDNELNAERQ
jgi:hypothetical protein